MNKQLPKNVTNAKTTQRLLQHLCVLLLALVLTSCSKPAQGGASLQLPSRALTTDEAAAQRLLARVQAVIDGESTSATLLVHEQELTSLAMPYLDGTPLDDLLVWIEPEGILVQTHVSWHGQHDLRAQIGLKANNGRIGLSLDALNVDQHAVARWLRASIAHAASDALSDVSWPLEVDEITLQEGVLLLKVHRMVSR